MIDKTTSFKKRAKGKKGNFKWKYKQVVTPAKKLKAGPWPETKCLHYKGNGHWKWKCREYLVDKEGWQSEQGYI